MALCEGTMTHLLKAGLLDDAGVGDVCELNQALGMVIFLFFSDPDV